MIQYLLRFSLMKTLRRLSDSYMNIKGWLTEIDRYGTEGVHKLIIGNKADLVERKVVQFEAAKVCCDTIRFSDCF